MKNATPIPWSELRAEFIGSGRLTLLALATSRDVPYGALLRLAKVERWDHARALSQARHRVADAERELAWLQPKVLAAARLAEQAAKRKRLDPMRFARAVKEASDTIGWAATSAWWVAEARHRLRNLAAGRPSDEGTLPKPKLGGQMLSAETDPEPRSHRVVLYYQDHPELEEAHKLAVAAIRAEAQAGGAA
jgi:hypothetical protein